MYQLIGVICVVAFALVMAFQQVYLGHLLQTMNPMFVMCATFGIGTLFFWAVGYRKFSGYLKGLSKVALPLTLLNICSALSWIAMFMSLKWLEPAIAVAICFALIPITMMLVSLFTGQGSKIKKLEIVSALGIAGSLLFLGFATVSGKSSITQLDLGTAKNGLLLATISGLAAAGILFFSKQLSMKGWSAQQVMSFRFPLLIALSFYLMPSDIHFPSMLQSHLREVLILSAFTVVIPLFLFQLGVERCSPMTVSLSMTVLPALTFLLQSFDKRLALSPFTLTGILGCVAFSAVGVYSRTRVVVSR